MAWSISRSDILFSRRFSASSRAPRYFIWPVRDPGGVSAVGKTMPFIPTLSSSHVQSSLSSRRHISSYAASRCGSVYPGHPMSCDSIDGGEGLRKKVIKSRIQVTRTATLVLHSGMAAVATGPRTPCNGSKTPQDVGPALEAVAAFSDSARRSWLAIPLFLRRFPLPFGLPPPLARRGIRAPLRALTKSFPKAPWPSIAPFSMGPILC